MNYDILDKEGGYAAAGHLRRMLRRAGPILPTAPPLSRH